MQKTEKNWNETEKITEYFPDIIIIFNCEGTIIHKHVPDKSSLFYFSAQSNTINDFDLPEKVKKDTEVSLQKVLKDKKQYSFFFYIEQTSKTSYYEARFIPIADDCVYAIFRDVTDIKRLENIQKKLKLHFRNILEKSKRGIAETDIDGNVMYANKFMINFLDNRCAVNQNIFSLFRVSEKKEVIDEFFNTDFGKNKNYTFCFYIDFEGKELKISFQYNDKHLLKDRHYYVEVEDVSDILRKEKLLQKSESTYRNLIELLPNGVIIKDDSKVLFANKKAIEILGFENLEQIIYFNFDDICLPEYKNILHEKNLIVSRQKETPSTEIKIKRFKDQKEIEIETITTSVNYLGKDAFQVIIRDVSMEKNILKTKLRADVAEENYQKLKKEIINRQFIEQQLSKSLEEKSILLKEVHHRVKNNLQIISSILNLEKKTIDLYKPKDILNRVQNRINSIYLVHELMYQTDSFSRIEFSKYIVLIAENMTRYNEYNDLRFEFKLEKIYLPLDIAVPCGMIVNECLYNYYENKHLFNGSNIIEISLYLKDMFVYFEIEYPVLLKPLSELKEITRHLSMQLLDALVDQISGEYSLEKTQSKKLKFILQFKI